MVSCEDGRWDDRIGERSPPRSERICREPLLGEVGLGAQSWMWVVVGEGAIVLERDEASSKRPPTSLKETLRFFGG